AAICAMAAVSLLLRLWQPADQWNSVANNEVAAAAAAHTRAEVIRAWAPWVLLSRVVFLGGVPRVQKFLNEIAAPKFQVAALHSVVIRPPPVVASPKPDRPTKPEEAVFTLNWLSATGSGILVSGIVAGLMMG